jgi:CTP synthase
VVSEHKNKDMRRVTIAVVGKYTSLKDSYRSVEKALEHASFRSGLIVEISWVNSEKIEIGVEEWQKIYKADGIIIPGGFGSRGVKGMVSVASYARRNNIPYLGICLGMQISMIELCKNYLNIKNATSEEFKEHPGEDVIVRIQQTEDLGGTMRKGAYSIVVKDDSILNKLYNSRYITERYRHRYEIDRKYIDKLSSKNVIFTENNSSIESLELKNHPFYLGVQFHPEFTSRVLQPSPVFVGFLSSIPDKRDKSKYSCIII